MTQYKMSYEFNQMEKYDIQGALRILAGGSVIARIWNRDYTVWKPQPEDISNRLGWLDIARRMAVESDRFNALSAEAREESVKDVVVLGMGGSSLAPEVLFRIFGMVPGAPRLTVMDNTAPAAVRAVRTSIDPAKTIFIAATKSGTTIETLSFLNYFYNQTRAQVGAEQAANRFIAITDPGSRLAETARSLSFRHLFLNDPEIGGRYSALSYFGLIPASLVGIDIARILISAREARGSCLPAVVEKNPGAWLGTILGRLALQGRNKLTLIIAPELAAFGDWVEQLIAESTGKEETGILPVVGEDPSLPGTYGRDRLFVYLRCGGDSTYQQQVVELREAAQPVITLTIRDRYDIGAQFFLWEFATAVAGYWMGINPFDQPNVEAAKRQAQAIMDGRMSTDDGAGRARIAGDSDLVVYGSGRAPNPGAAVRQFLDRSEQGDYLCIQLYSAQSAETDRLLAELRSILRRRRNIAVTAGYGPRYLHSTGQLHKGDSGRGLFIQITREHEDDIAIPDEPGSEASGRSFAELCTAQAFGDQRALLDLGRRVLHVHCRSSVNQVLRQVARQLV